MSSLSVRRTGVQVNLISLVLMAYTSYRPFDLDDAVLRRLPRRLLIDLPGRKERAGSIHVIVLFCVELNMMAYFIRDSQDSVARRNPSSRSRSRILSETN